LAENQVKLLAATATIDTLANDRDKLAIANAELAATVTKLMTPETNLVPLDKNGVPQP
jgi:hypothetical protein